MIFAGRCGNIDFDVNLPDVNIPIDSINHYLNIEGIPTPNVTNVEKENVQLDSLLEKIDSLAGVNDSLAQIAKHEFRRHYKYKAEAIKWKTLYTNLVDSVAQFTYLDSDNEVALKGQISILSDELKKCGGFLTQAEKDVETEQGRYRALVFDLDRKYVNEYTDSLGNGLILHSKIVSDGFKIRPEMYTYKLAGQLPSKRMFLGRTNTKRRTQVALMWGASALQDKNRMLSALYSRNLVGVNFYAQPIYQYENKNFSNGAIGGMLGLGFNFK